MSANIYPIYPIAPYAVAASLSATTACATRAPVPVANLAANNIIQLVPANVGAGNGVRIDKIQVQGSSSSETAATTAGLVTIWMNDGTNAWVIDEIQMTGVTPSATTPSENKYHTYTNLVLPATYSLYVSTSVTTTASTNAISVQAFGGTY